MADTRDPKNRTASANFVLQGRALARLYALTDPHGALRAVITARTLPEAMDQARATHRLTRQWRLRTCAVTWAAAAEPAAKGASE